jgi:hypothetical protein
MLFLLERFLLVRICSMSFYKAHARTCSSAGDGHSRDVSDTTIPGRFHVEIADDIGYSEDYFDFEELPGPLRSEIENTPAKGTWVYDDGSGGTWTVTAK